MSFLPPPEVYLYVFLHIYDVDYFACARAQRFENQILTLNANARRRYIILDYAYELIVSMTSDLTWICCLAQLALETFPVVHADTCINPAHFVLLKPLL